jgi:hypothetical protein
MRIAELFKEIQKLDPNKPAEMINIGKKIEEYQSGLGAWLKETKVGDAKNAEDVQLAMQADIAQYLVRSKQPGLLKREEQDILLNVTDNINRNFFKQSPMIATFKTLFLSASKHCMQDEYRGDKESKRKDPDLYSTDRELMDHEREGIHPEGIRIIELEIKIDKLVSTYTGQWYADHRKLALDMQDDIHRLVTFSDFQAIKDEKKADDEDEVIAIGKKNNVDSLYDQISDRLAKYQTILEAKHSKALLGGLKSLTTQYHNAQDDKKRDYDSDDDVKKGPTHPNPFGR